MSAARPPVGAHSLSQGKGHRPEGAPESPAGPPVELHPAAPATLDHAGIAARVPHHGSMCLLDSLLGWTDDNVTCSAISHRDPGHPLLSESGLLAAAGL